MAKGSPNGPDKILNGVLKVFDPKADNGNGAFRPSYIAPDATNIIQGDVLLSDAIDSNDNAATGITAATPKAVKTVNDNAETKLSKTETATQTVAGPVTFSNDVAGNKFTANIAGQDNGVAGFVGNASSANKLDQEATINIINGTKANGSSNTYSINFDGSKTTTFNISQLDAKSLVGMVPLASIPKAALERLISVADETARFALTTDNVQLGDTVYQNDTGVMYLVIDDIKLNSADGYQEYKAGSAVTAMTLGKDTVGKVTDESGNHYQVWYLEEGQPKKFTETIGALDKPVYVKNGILTPIEEIKTGVSGVKGDYETTYRDGDVNLTYEDIPAVGVEHITESSDEDAPYFLAKVPHKTDTTPLYLNETIASKVNSDLGTNKYPYDNIYATKLNGIAESANKLNKSIQITGAVQSQVKELTIDGSLINIETSYPTGQGVVMVSATEPTDPNVLIWIQP